MMMLSVSPTDWHVSRIRYRIHHHRRRHHHHPPLHPPPRHPHHHVMIN